jgi:hypothetical protein
VLKEGEMPPESAAHPVLPTARSAWECQTYLGLVGCPSCGNTGLDMTEFRSGRRGDIEVWSYRTECAACAQPQAFEFRHTGDPPPFPEFGGPEPSELVDPGQFLALAERLAELMPADPADLVADLGPAGRDSALGGLHRAAEDIAIAVAAVTETLKFVPAAGTAVPREAFWVEASVARYDREPEVFGKRQLMAVLGVLRQDHSTYAMALG